MKYAGMPLGMWLLFKKSFRDNLVSVLGLSEAEAGRIAAQAKSEYKRIILSLPEFEKGDRFKMNIVNCTMFAACEILQQIHDDRSYALVLPDGRERQVQ